MIGEGAVGSEVVPDASFIKEGLAFEITHEEKFLVGLVLCPLAIGTCIKKLNLCATVLLLFRISSNF